MRFSRSFELLVSDGNISISSGKSEFTLLNISRQQARYWHRQCDVWAVGGLNIKTAFIVGHRLHSRKYNPRTLILDRATNRLCLFHFLTRLD